MQQLSLNSLIERSRLVAIAVIAIGILLLLEITNLLSNGNFSSLNLSIIGILIGLPTSFLIVKYWRTSFYGVILLLVFEGVVRNLTNQVAFLLIKDVVISLIYVGYLREYRFRLVFSAKFRLVFIVVLTLSLYSLAELLNPALPSLLVGLVGIKTLLFYVPLIYITYAVTDNLNKVVKFCVLVMVLANISCVFGYAQYFGGYDVIKIFSPVQIFGSFGNLGQYYKLPGSFGAAGNFSEYLFIAFALAIGLLYSKCSKRLTTFSWFTIVNVCIMFVLNTQRASWIFVILCFLLGIFAQTSSSKTVLLRFGLVAILLGGFLLAISSTNNIIGDRFSQFTTGTGIQDYLVDAPTGSVKLQLGRLAQGNIFGFGIGIAAPGARYVVGGLEFVEAYTAILLYEIGIPGLILTLSLDFLTVYLITKALRITKDPHYHNLIYYILIWQVLQILLGLTYSPLTVPPSTQFFWIFPAIAMRLQTIEEERAFTKIQQTVKGSFLSKLLVT